tara:strand:- start:154 stop:312 length:159 start_codon:yes stop_codon:yes gene_type:complete
MHLSTTLDAAAVKMMHEAGSCVFAHYSTITLCLKLKVVKNSAYWQNPPTSEI